MSSIEKIQAPSHFANLGNSAFLRQSCLARFAHIGPQRKGGDAVSALAEVYISWSEFPMDYDHFGSVSLSKISLHSFSLFQ